MFFGGWVGFCFCFLAPFLFLIYLLADHVCFSLVIKNSTLSITSSFFLNDTVGKPFTKVLKVLVKVGREQN